MHAMTRSQLRSVAPSIFTRSAYRTMTPRYRVAATADVVDLLEGIGLFPVRAQQSRCRTPDKRDFVKHLIRFRRAEDLQAAIADEIAEVCLTNSFDGSSAYRLYLGVFRVACTNGLVCPIGDLGGFSVRHSGGDDYGQRIIDATYSVVSEAPKALETVKAWKQIALPAPVQHAYAEAARVAIDSPHVTAEQLLQPRRPEDESAPDGSRSLWATFNVAQEAALKGGIQNRTATGRKTTTRPVKSVTRDVALNKALWTLAEKMAEIVG